MREVDEVLLSLLDAAPDIVWLTDPRASCVFLNQQWCDFTGQTLEKGLGMGWESALHAKDRDLCLNQLQVAHAKRESFRIEYRLRGRNGEYRWMLGSGAPRFGTDGAFTGFIGTVVDIHNRKEAEERLRTSEERYRYLFESIDEAFGVIEVIFGEGGQAVDFRWLETNPSFEQETGLADARGKRARELVPNLDKFWCDVYAKVALTGESIRFNDHAEAMGRWFDVFAFRVDRPEQHRVAVLFKDITQRKTRELNAAFLAELSGDFARALTAEEILAKAGEKLCRYLNVASAAFVRVDDGNKIVTVFHERREDVRLPSLVGTHRLSNFMNERFIAELRSGRTVAVRDVATDPGMAGMVEAYEKLGVRSHIQGSYVSEGHWKFMLSVHASEPRDWRDGEIELVRDLTALVWLRIERAWAEENLRKSEQSLRELSRSLEHRVMERTAELNEQAARLRHLAADLASAKQRERKRFAALLHDHLQQYLVAARMHLKMASRRMKDANDRQAVDQAGKWIQEAKNAARDLTRQLRPAALYEDGLMSALYGLASEMWERHHLKVVIERHDTNPSMSDDVKALLFDAIRELLFNAVKYAEVNEASVCLWEGGRNFCAVVEDQGTGFDANAVLMKAASNGSGLFSIRERLAARGGKINIESPAEKGGTRIVLEVPLDPVLEAPGGETGGKTGIDRTHEAETLTPADTGRRIRILIVDDHAMVRQGLATMLSEDDRLEVVAEAADGIAGVEAVERYRPDLALIDVNMPRMNGIEAAREIHRRWPETIIIGLSVQDDDATAKAMRDAGASAFLSKAGDSESMISTIVELVGS